MVQRQEVIRKTTRRVSLRILAAMLFALAGGEAGAGITGFVPRSDNRGMLITVTGSGIYHGDQFCLQSVCADVGRFRGGFGFAVAGGGSDRGHQRDFEHRDDERDFDEQFEFFCRAAHHRVHASIRGESDGGVCVGVNFIVGEHDGDVHGGVGRCGDSDLD